MEQDSLQENNSLMTFKGVIGRKRYFINFALLMVGFILVGLLFLLAIFVDDSIAADLRPTILSKTFFIAAITSAIPLLYMSWINKFKRIRDIRGTKEKEKIWFGMWIVLGIIPYTGILISIGLGCFKGKITQQEP